MVLEIHPHSWKSRYSSRFRADFFPFVDGVPRYDLKCEDCDFYIDDNTDCRKAKEIGTDDKLYPFCGPICGYFKAEGISL